MLQVTSILSFEKVSPSTLLANLTCPAMAHQEGDKAAALLHAPLPGP